MVRDGRETFEQATRKFRTGERQSSLWAETVLTLSSMSRRPFNWSKVRKSKWRLKKRPERRPGVWSGWVSGSTLFWVRGEARSRKMIWNWDCLPVALEGNKGSLWRTWRDRGPVSCLMTQVLSDVGSAEGSGDAASAVILKMDRENLGLGLMWGEIGTGVKEDAKVWGSAVEGMTTSQKCWVVRVRAWAGQPEQAHLRHRLIKPTSGTAGQERCFLCGHPGKGNKTSSGPRPSQSSGSWHEV